MQFEINLFNYATKVNVNNATGVDTSKCPKNVDLASLKSLDFKLYIIYYILNYI